MTSRRISSDNRHAQKDKRYRHAQKDREKNCRKEADEQAERYKQEVAEQIGSKQAEGI